MQLSRTNHYETLGVAPGVTSVALKSAYLELIREFTPENDPERFRLISEAYRTLSNPAKRKAYDREEGLPKAARAEFERVMAAAEDEETEKTIEGLAAIWDTYKQSTGSRQVGFLLGVLLDSEGRDKEAAEIFKVLAERDAGDVQALVWYGDALQKSGNVPRGRRALKEAIVRDKDCTEAYLCLARTYREVEHWEESIKILDRGIHADGIVDVQDLPLFIEKLLTLSLMGDLGRLESAAEELVAAVPFSDQEARKYAASQLGPLLELFLEGERFDISDIILELGLKLDPSNREARKLADELKPAAKVQRNTATKAEGSEDAEDGCASGILKALFWIAIYFFIKHASR